MKQLRRYFMTTGLWVGILMFLRRDDQRNGAYVR